MVIMKKLKVMIVEDESIIAFDMRNMMIDLGFEVCAMAVSGEEAVKKAGMFCPDIVLMDILLAGEMNGIEAAGSIKEQYDIPSLYVTANTDMLNMIKECKSELFGFIIKPARPDDLLLAIDFTLRHHDLEPILNEKVSNLK
jgi:DNA-binding NtrC family response regulator